MTAATPLSDWAPVIVGLIAAAGMYLWAHLMHRQVVRQRALEAHPPGPTDPKFRRDLKALDDLILKLTREPQERRAEAVAKVWAAKEALLAVANEAERSGSPPAADRHAAE